jgi:hypothetical protein
MIAKYYLEVEVVSSSIPSVSSQKGIGKYYKKINKGWTEKKM